MARLIWGVANLAAVQVAVEAMAVRTPGPAEFGEWSWLRVFDAEDLREFIRDIRAAIIVAAKEGSCELLDEQLRAWRVTAEQADDPLFREILRGGAFEADFVEVQRPMSAKPGRRSAAE